MYKQKKILYMYPQLNHFVFIKKCGKYTKVGNNTELFSYKNFMESFIL